jgi:SAM-dependent methyltransferase
MVSKNFNPSLSHPLYIIRKGLYNKIKEHAPSLTGKLLDFGCGEKPYKSLFTNVTSYVGVDYDSEGHSHKNEQIEFFYDGKTLPFANEEFDSLFSSEVFEHIFNLEQILPEINRVLRTNGKMLITCPFSWEEHEIPVDYARYTQFALKDLLEKNGFRIITFEKSGHYVSTLHQLFIVYLNDYWFFHVFFSKFALLRKALRQITIPVLNALYKCVDWMWPKSDKLYLNNIIIAEKIK